MIGRIGPALARRAARLRRDERGFVLVFVAVALPALLGLVGLAIDGARLFTLDAQLAATVDSAALAAANELDRSPGAMENARAAALGLGNDASLAEGGAEQTAFRFRFAASLSDLRESPTFTLSDEAAESAAYVEVTSAPRSLVASFLSLVGVRMPSLARRSIASSQYYACDVTPLLLCHADPAAFAARATPGRQYLLRLDPLAPNGSVTVVGPHDDPGVRRISNLLASDAPAFCYADGITQRRNMAASDFDDAMNVRFDRYFNGRGAIAPELAVYPPAPDIVQGRRLNACTSPPEGGDINPPFHLPRDPGLRTVNAATPYDAGTGDWKTTAPYGGSGAEPGTALDEYLVWNHANKSQLFQDQLRSSTTRYEIYLKELGLDAATETVPVPTRGGLAAAGTMPTGGPLDAAFNGVRETPVPRCYAGPTPAAQARRRIVYMSVTDCGVSDPGAALLSRYVGKFFLTEPSTAGALLVEFVNMVRPRQDDGKLRHVVVLVDIS